MLHHIEIYVSDLARSVDFWQWVLEDELGYSLYQKWEQGKSWKKDDHYIVFVQTEDKYQNIPYHRCATGLNHLAFLGRSRAHIDALYKALQQKNINVLYTEKYPHAGGDDHYAVYFEDPDRIKVEIIAAEETK